MSDQVVVVTGGGRGIGRAICERFASQGAQVVAASRTVDELETVKASIQQAGGRCETQTVDVCSTGDVDALIATTLQQFGRIDVLVNNAGVAPFCKIEELEPSVFRSLTAVNMEAVYYTCRAVWPAMRQQGGGVIINISSVLSVDTFTGFSAYGASKAWVSGWTRGLADEGESLGIKVYAIAPGAVETKLLRATFPDYPSDQVLAPSRIADVAVSLTEPDVDHKPGDTIFVRPEEN